jgi:hypothetical protein
MPADMAKIGGGDLAITPTPSGLEYGVVRFYNLLH